MAGPTPRAPSRPLHRAAVALAPRSGCAGRRILASAVVGALASSAALAQNRSAPAFLQVFDASYNTLERRSADIFSAGYGALWIPPVSRADSGDLSVGYDVYDRFDLGRPGRPTLYGTETGLKHSISVLRRAGVGTYVDLVWNHNGFSDLGTPGFVQSGGYPGFVTTLPDDVDGDFHGRFEGGDWNGRLAGLIDIAQEKNYQYIRNPVTAGDPQNLPAGTVPAFGRLANVPTEANRRFYPDRNRNPGRIVFDPATGEQNIPIYDFTADAGSTGDPVPENAVGYLMRNTQWLVQEIGVDGFRLDAVKHAPQWVWNYYDRSVYRANPRPLLDGSTNHVFSFGEIFDGNKPLLQSYIRKTINPSQPGTVGGNRDALDFPLYFAMRDNLSSNGFQNDWRNVANASQDIQDDGLANNGSQAVAFVQSHDKGGPHLGNVAHAYVLMRPGNANVYFNAVEFGVRTNGFPADGRGDALGGLYGDRITNLVNIRNTHGRGNYLERWLDKETLVYERQNSALVALNNRLDGGFDSRTVQTSFAPGTPLVELTGNATDGAFDPFDDFSDGVIISATGTASIRIPRNRAPGANGVQHNSGYLVYGLAGPRGTLTIGNVSQTLAPETPSASTNGTARLTAIDVITADSFTVSLNTSAVTVKARPAAGQPYQFIRDRSADGDNALIRVNGGIDVNGNGVVDYINPGATSYGFDEFATLKSPGYSNADGNGSYAQAIDATALPEGYNFVTVRAYRQRSDGGPAVYTDFRRPVYIDRLKPVSSVASFEPWDAANPANRDLIVRSDDKTADRVHVFLNLPAGTSDATILSWVGQGNRAGSHDRDLFKYGYFGVQAGNNVATVVTYEITGNYSIQRIPGVFVAQGQGAGLGDLDGDGTFTTADVANVAGAFEQVLYSRNAEFNPAADLNADGRVDSLDLFALPALWAGNGAAQDVRDETRAMTVRRGNVNNQDATDAADIDFLVSRFGAIGDIWREDLDVDGLVGAGDVSTLIRAILLTEFGDANLDQRVDIGDFSTLAANFNAAGGWGLGDFDGDGLVGIGDFSQMAANFNFVGGAPGGLPEGAFLARGASAVPEPGVVTVLLAGSTLLLRRRRAASAS